MAGARSSSFQILLVDESPDESVFVVRTAANLEPPLDISVAKSFAEASDLLGQIGQQRSLMPRFLLISQRLGEKSGLELLQFVRSIPALTRLPVGILSSDASRQEIAEAYENGATCFFFRPTNIPGMRLFLTSLRHSMEVDPPNYGSLRQLPYFHSDPGTDRRSAAA